MTSPTSSPTSGPASDPALGQAAVDWAAVIADGGSVPAGRRREDLVAELANMLGDPDPAIRDDTAYPIFATWIVRGELDGLLGGIGDAMVEMWRDERIQARTFAALILAAVLRRDAASGELTPAVVRRWRDAFAAWWVAEHDIRGYDDRVGWLHAIAHGADTVRAFARSPHLDANDLDTLLRLAAERLLVPTEYRFGQFEGERLGYGIAAALCRPELADAVGWLDALHAAIEAGEPGPTPPWAANVIDTLTALFVAVQRGVRFYDPVTSEPSETIVPPARDAILDRITEILRLPAYWLG